MNNAPEAWGVLMDKLVDAVAAYLGQQIEGRGAVRTVV